MLNHWMIHLSKERVIPHRLAVLKDKPLICASCHFGRAHKRLWQTKGKHTKTMGFVCPKIKLCLRNQYWSLQSTKDGLPTFPLTQSPTTNINQLFIFIYCEFIYIYVFLCLYVYEYISIHVQMLIHR